MLRTCIIIKCLCTHPLKCADDKCEVLSLAELMRCLLTNMDPITKFSPSELLSMPPGFLLFSPDKVHLYLTYTTVHCEYFVSKIFRAIIFHVK